MNLTGKCKIDFEKWLNSKEEFIKIHDLLNIEIDLRNIYIFDKLNNSMKYGVYLDFFDSVGMMIELQLHVNPTMQGGSFKCIRPAIFSDGRFHNVGASFGTRERARAASIKKANEIYNLK